MVEDLAVILGAVAQITKLRYNCATALIHYQFIEE
jgi:hypothetical protein